MDLTTKINREPYKPSEVSNASPNMAVSPPPLSKDMIGRINNELYSSSGVSMTKSSPAGTVNRLQTDMFISNYGDLSRQSNPYPIDSYPSTGYGALAILVILLVVIGIVIYAVVLLLRFLF